MRHVSAFRAVLVLAICCSGLHLGLAQANAGAAEPDARARHLELLKLAPTGTFGVVFHDLDQIASSPVSVPVPLLMRGIPRGASLKASFFLPRPAAEWTGVEPVACGVIETKGISRRELEELFSPFECETTVSGTRCYDVPDVAFFAFPEDGTILMGGDRAALGTMLATYTGSGEKGMDAALWKLVEPLAGRGSYAAAILPTELRNMWPPEPESLFPIPPVLEDMQAFSLGVGLDGYELVGMLRLGSSDSAKRALEGARAEISGLRTTMEEQMRADPAAEEFLGQEVGLLNRIELASDGQEVRVRLAVSQEEMAEFKGNWLGLLMYRLVVEPASQGSALALESSRAAPPSSPRERQMELLNLAPKGTWAVHVTDFTQIPADANCYLTTRGCAGPTFPGTTLDVGFCLPPEGEADSHVPVCGVTRLEGIWASDIAQALKRVSETMEVEGMDAYDMSDGPFVALADDRTVLTGSSKSALGKIVKAYCDPASRGTDPDVRRLIDPFIGRAIYSCGLAPPTVRNPESEILGLQPVGGCVGGTRDVDVANGYALRASFMTAGPEQAAQAAEKARSYVASVIELEKAEREQAPQPVEGEDWETALLQRIGIASEGGDVKVELIISEDELKKLPEYWESCLINALFFAPSSVSVNFMRPSAYRNDAMWRLHDAVDILGLYEADHGVAYPDSLAPVAEAGYFKDTEFFVQDSDARVLLAWYGGKLLSHRYVGHIPYDTPGPTIIVYSAKGMFPGGRNVAFASGRVEWVTEAELHDPGGPPSTSLLASYASMKAPVKAPRHLDSCPL